MAVAHDTAVESHTGTAGSTNEASFDISITPASNVRGILVFTYVNADAGDALSVKINPAGVNLDVPAVTGGEAADTAAETGRCKAWLLGSDIPAGTLTIRVNRNNNGNEMYAVVISVTALTDVEPTGVVLVQEDGTLAEQSVTDGSPGTNSVRYAAVNSGLSTIGTAAAANTCIPGANSTRLLSIDFGNRVADSMLETTAGQGARSVGFSSTTSDDRAAVHLAIRETGKTQRTPSIASLSASGNGSSPVQSLLLSPIVGILASIGSAVQFLGRMAPLVGALVLTSIPSVAAQNALITNGGILFFGLDEAASASLTPTVGFLTLNGNTPSLLRDTRLTPDAGALVIASAAPTVSQSSLVTPLVGSLTVSPNSPSLLENTIRGPPDGTVALTSYAPTLINNTIQQTLVGSIAFTVVGPTTVQSIVLTPAAGSISYAGSAASPIQSTLLTPSVTAIAASGVAGQLNFSVISIVGSAALTGLTPTTERGTRIDVSAGSSIALGISPSLNYGILSSLGSITVTGLAPILQVPGDTTITPTTGVIATSGNSLVVNLSIGPTSGSLVLTGIGSTFDWAIRGDVGTVFIAGSAPNNNLGLQPLSATLNIVGTSPPLSLTVAPSSGSAAFLQIAPVVIQGSFSSPVVGSILLSGSAPYSNLSIQPLTSGLAIVGAAPNLASAITPASGSLVFIGSPPTGGGASISAFSGALVFGLAGDENIVPSIGALSITGRIPGLEPAPFVKTPASGLAFFGLSGDTNITPAIASIIIAGQTSTTELGSSERTPSIGALTVVGQNALLSQIFTAYIIPTTGTLVLYRNPTPPSQDMGLTASAPLLNFTQIGVVGTLALAPSASGPVQGRPQSPLVATLIFAGGNALLDLAVGPTVGALSLTGFASQAFITIQPLAGNLIALGAAPIATQNRDATAAAGSITLAGTSSVVNRGCIPGLGSLALTGLQPTVQQSVPVNFNILTNAGILSSTIQSPALLTALIFTPATGSLAATPQGSQWNLTASPQFGIIALVGSQPSTQHPNTSAPGVASLNLTGQLLTALAPVNIIPLTGSLALAGQTSAFGQLISPVTGVANFVTSSPSLFHAAIVQPSTGALAASGQQGMTGLLVISGAGALIIDGQVGVLSGPVLRIPLGAMLAIVTSQPTVIRAELLPPEIIQLADRRSYVGLADARVYVALAELRDYVEIGV